MRTWKKIAASFCMAAMSVYSGGAGAANPSDSADHPESASANPIRVLATDYAAPAAPTTAPGMRSNSDGTFTLNITRDADLVETLRMIGYQAQKSIIPSRQVHGTLPALDLYNVTVHEALDAILKINGFAYRENGNFIYVYSDKEIADMERAKRRTTTEVFRTYYTPAANALTMIKPVLSSEGQVAITTPASTGIDSGGKDAGGNAHASEDILVVTDYSENLEKVRRVLKEIDRRPQQILVEATILSASLSEDNQFGVDFTAMGGVDFSTLTGGAGSSGASVNDAVNGNILNDNKVGSITDRGYGAAQLSNNGLQVGLVKDNIGVFIKALEGITDTTILANPKILSLNKQKGEVIVGREDGYITTTVTSNASVQTVEYLDTGTRLIFRPYIGDDGFVRMEIHPEDSTGGLTSTNLPFKITTEVTSNVMVKDGHTIVIGGLFRESTNTSRSQIPVLGNIPLAGYLFRQQQDITVRQEIIILLTPHIVKDDSAYSEESQKVMQDAERIRIGARHGLMPFGRERLAEGDYEQAVSEMRKDHPDRNKALWNLDCAIDLNPRFLEAIQMKEQLTGETLSDVDNSSIRGFLTREIIAERQTPATRPVALPASNLAPKPAARMVEKKAPTTLPVAVRPSPSGNWGWHTLYSPIADQSQRWALDLELSFTPPQQFAGEHQ
ncbi:MAG: type II secretion system protein GspD [Phycisphaerae bacterium]|nr:type II secretion system protein GspD [Phycisphaerae bacterium]